MEYAVFACRKCGYSQAIDPVHIGSVFSCPTCGNVVEVTPPAPPATPEARPGPASPQPQAAATVQPGQSLPSMGGAGAPSQEAAMAAAQAAVANALAAQAGAAAPQSGGPLPFPGMGAPQPQARPKNGLFGNTAVFLLLYILFVAPTYLLPYLGYDVTANLSASWASDRLLWPLLGFMACCFALIAVTLLRGLAINKSWIALFPILAVAFALFPGINPVPYIPAGLHILTVLLGVGLART